jgi:hypothetical protein
MEVLVHVDRVAVARVALGCAHEAMSGMVHALLFPEQCVRKRDT